MNNKLSDMKITIHYKKKENRYIKPFVEFYLSTYFPKIKKVDIGCPDKNNQQKAPDYFLVQPKIAVEIKGVYEREELEESIATAQNRERLQKALDKLIKKEKFLKNACFLNYPWRLKVKRGKEEIVARKIIKGVKQNQKDFKIEEVGQFKIIGFSKERKALFFYFNFLPFTYNCYSIFDRVRKFRFFCE